MKRTDWKQFSLKRYDRLLMVLFSLLLGLAASSCEPDVPAPEYGVQPMYGVRTAVVDQQNPA
ncbi:MAG TPA: hypothetical protein VFP20_07930 [Bacteroidales bacterium]|nr:hypothetical protein [Bacteroidales bacterium]